MWQHLEFLNAGMGTVGFLRGNGDAADVDGDPRSTDDSVWTLVVEDDDAHREAICTILADAGYEVRSAATVRRALELVVGCRPAMVIADVMLPVQSGYELCRSLRETFGETLPIILISGERIEPLDSVVGLMLGADDYLTKPYPSEELLARVRRSLVRASAAREDDRIASAAYDLTARESEILSLLAEGLPQKAIAERLVISSKTAATHIQRVLKKLGVHSRAEAVAMAYRTGLLSAAPQAAGSSNGHSRERPDTAAGSTNGHSRERPDTAAGSSNGHSRERLDNEPAAAAPPGRR